jgi:hypothetical protein
MSLRHLFNSSWSVILHTCELHVTGIVCNVITWCVSLTWMCVCGCAPVPEVQHTYYIHTHMQFQIQYRDIAPGVLCLWAYWYTCLVCYYIQLLTSPQKYHGIPLMQSYSPVACSHAALRAHLPPCSSIFAHIPCHISSHAQNVTVQSRRVFLQGIHLMLIMRRGAVCTWPYYWYLPGGSEYLYVHMLCLFH